MWKNIRRGERNEKTITNLCDSTFSIGYSSAASASTGTITKEEVAIQE